jgi:tetratricopeptide (TPR) repeat protein
LASTHGRKGVLRPVQFRDSPRLSVQLYRESGSSMQSDTLTPPELDVFCDQGRALHQAGQLEEARCVYEAVLRADPEHFQALHLLGVACIQSGNLQAGAELIERALQMRPDDGAALGNLATALNGLGRHEAAIGCCDRALALQPLDAPAHGNRGAALHALERPAEALESYDRAAALRPDQAKNHFNRGVVLYALGRLAEAVEAHRRACALHPAFVEAHRNAGRALRELGQGEEALVAYNAALALRPADAELHHARANVLFELERSAEALEAYDHALTLKPDYADAWANRVLALRDLLRPEEGLASADRAVALEPDNAEAQNKRGTALYEFQRLDEALACFDRAIGLAPQHPQAHLNRAVILNQQRRLSEAMASFDQALVLTPDNSEVHFHRAMCRLSLGEGADAWRQYEHRWRTRQFRPSVRGFAMPLWLGGEDLKGRTILVHGEQGLGDVLQFCRYVPVVTDLGATVAFEVYPQLVRLMQRMTGVAVVPRHDALSIPCDYHVPLMSLPLALDAQPHEHSTPYLSPDPEDAAAWARRLEGIEGLRVGLCWAGGTRLGQPIAHAIDMRRSLSLAAFRPLADLPNVRFVSLQKGPPAAELAVADGWPGEPILDLTDELSDFADTAALIANLDLVITCDTSTAHLAGALGKPVWILNRFDSCWRWGQDPDDTPWYPTARLFTQRAPGEWVGVMQAVKAALAQRSGKAEPAPRA